MGVGVVLLGLPAAGCGKAVHPAGYRAMIAIPAGAEVLPRGPVERHAARSGRRRDGRRRDGRRRRAGGRRRAGPTAGIRGEENGGRTDRHGDCRCDPGEGEEAGDRGPRRGQAKVARPRLGRSPDGGQDRATRRGQELSRAVLRPRGQVDVRSQGALMPAGPSRSRSAGLRGCGWRLVRRRRGRTAGQQAHRREEGPDESRRVVLVGRPARSEDVYPVLDQGEDLGVVLERHEDPRVAVHRHGRGPILDPGARACVPRTRGCEPCIDGRAGFDGH